MTTLNTIVQIGSKKNRSSITVFVNDAVNGAFFTSKGLGMDLTANISYQWLNNVVAKIPAAMERIKSHLQTESSVHWMANELSWNENTQSFKPTGLSIATLFTYLAELNIIKYNSHDLVDSSQQNTGWIYNISSALD